MSTENNVADGEKKDIRYFLDTCALMNHCRELDEPIAISSITLQELNSIKENKNKTDQVRFKAREAARWIKSRIDDVKVVNFDPKLLSRFNALSLQDTPDNRIILCADEYTFYNSNCVFWTEDTLCLIIAKRVFNIPCKEIESSSSGKYTGWIDRQLTDEEIAAVYEKPTENTLNLLTNQYAVIKGSNAQEAVKWDGASYVRVKVPAIKSFMYGTVKPYQGDIYQQMALDSMMNNQITMIKGHAGTGKAQPNSTLIPTPNGVRRLDELQVGDVVYDRLGKKTTIIGIYPRGYLDNYKITFSDGRTAYCNDDHMWTYYSYDGSFRNATVNEMLTHGIKRKCGNHWKYNYAIPVNKAIEKEEINYDIDPYVIGAFLGDGCCTASALTLASADEDLVAYVAKLIGAHSYYEQNKYSWIFRFREATGGGSACNYRTKDFFKKYVNELLGKADKKRIPEEYKNGSISQRKTLLQGLLDTDGTISKDIGIIRFFSNSIQLIKDVQELCWSLGYCATMAEYHKERENPEYYLQILCPPQEKPSIFHLKRKKDIAYRFSIRKKKSHFNDRISIRKIEKVGQEEMRCIMVDNSEQLYLTHNYIVTHNTYLSLGYLMSQLEKHKIEKIIIFCNPVSTKDAAQLGYLPGTADQKLMDSQIGNTLKSKLGGEFGVSKMLNDETLMLLPMSNIRGFDTGGYGPVGVYITEAQNYTISLMKLALQRIGEDSKVIIDGDYTTQVDRPEYAGSNNGMIRMSEVFRGKKPYGEVELKNIYRSQIARIADEM